MSKNKNIFKKIDYAEILRKLPEIKNKNKNK